MKTNLRCLGVYIVLWIMCCGSLAFAQKKTGQGTMTLSLKGANLEVALEAIKSQTGYSLMYPPQVLRQSKPVTVEVTDMEVIDFLKLILVNQPVDFIIEKKSIMLFEKNKPLSVSQAGFQVNGIVVDSLTGKYLAGATLSLKGKNWSLSSGENGYFQIPVGIGDILMVSFMGYQTNVISIGNMRRTVRVALLPLSHDLDEVTVSTGYQQIDRRKLTSAVTTLKGSDIINPGMFSIDQALEGRVPGLFVLNNSGDIGASPKIRIRGTSTLLGNREPLWVVDGVVVNDPVNIDPASINDLDFVNRIGNAISGVKPFDIEQIDVLKDATATALYGVRAANGVIVITTKKGKLGAPSINFNQSTNVIQRPRYTDGNVRVMDSRQRIDFSKELVEKGQNYGDYINYVGYEGALNKLYTGVYGYEQFQQEVHKLETMNTDWFDVIMHDAVSTQNSLSLSGGTADTKYFTSLGANTQRGTTRGDKINQYSGLIKLNSTLGKKLGFEINLRGNLENRDFVAGSVNALSYAYNTSRAVPAYMEDGGLSYYKRYSAGYGESNYYNYNIVNEINNSRNTINSAGIALTSNLNYRHNQYLSGTLLVNLSSNNTNDQTIYGENTFYAAGLRRSEFGEQPNPATTNLPFGGEYQSNNTRNRSYLLRGQVNFTHPIGHDKPDQLDVTFGTEMSSNKYSGLKTTQRGYMEDRGQIFTAVDPTKYPTYTQWAMGNVDLLNNQLSNLVSGYLATAYTINDRYILNFNTRTDFSNKFGNRAREKFLPTWSFSGRWDIDKDFFSHSEIVNMLALKASYGYQGNMLDNQTPDLIIKQGALEPISEEYYSNIAYYPNPNLKWEKNRSINIGTDFSFFNNKIQGTINYFYRKTVDAFLDKRVADINGLTTYVVNSGNITNQGLELSFSFLPINRLAANGSGKGFSWRIDPQLGQVLNRVISNAINHYGLNEYFGSQNANLYTNYLNGSQIIDGKAVNTFYSYAFNGLDPKTGLPTFKNDNPELRDKYRSEEVDEVFQQVMVPGGNRIPTFQGGLLNAFTYKNFGLSFNLTYNFGNKIRLTKLYTSSSQSSNSYTAAPYPESNVPIDFIDRWREPGDEAFTNIPALVSGTTFSRTQNHWSAGYAFQYAQNIWAMYDNSDIRVVSGNFVKLKTANFRYTLPETMVKKLSLKSASVLVSGMNLYTWASSKLKGLDPEQSAFGEMTMVSPRPTYSFTLDITF